MVCVRACVRLVCLFVYYYYYYYYYRRVIKNPGFSWVTWRSASLQGISVIAYTTHIKFAERDVAPW